MIVQQLVVILVLSQDGVRAHPSTPPSWTNLKDVLDGVVNKKWIFFKFKMSNFIIKAQHSGLGSVDTREVNKNKSQIQLNIVVIYA